MEHITSRKNKIVTHFRALARENSYRHEQGLFLCDGEKFLREAMAWGGAIEAVVWRAGKERNAPEIPGALQYTVPDDLMDYISPLKNTPGPVFSVRMRKEKQPERTDSVIVLENVQDPGNVGTVLRTANALNIDTVVLCGDCADLYNPKTVRSTMGAIFRQHVLELDVEALQAYIREQGLELYGAALRDDAADIRTLPRRRRAIAIGSEGQGLSDALIAACDGLLIIPMNPESESLNAAVAASLCMWEMTR